MISPFSKMSSNDADDSQECQLDKQQQQAVILVHGAGSFGHHTAKEFHLSGYSNDTEQPIPTTQRHSKTMEGLARTRHSVQKLNQRIVAQLLMEGVPAVGISPCFGSIHNLDALRNENQRLTQIVQETLRAGLVPVLHGDACLYGTSAGILSGDTLVQMCSPLAHRVVFLTDVDGVYNSDPKANPTAELIPSIPVDGHGNLLLSSHSFIQATESTHNHDVTGGLKTKLAAAIAIASSTGRTVTIVKSGSSSADHILLQREFKDEDVRCTRIFRQEQ